MPQQVYITNIQKFSTHDGPGIRTNVFFKGCRLRCKWCANPENIAPYPQLLYHKVKCVSCGKCTTVCPHGALHVADGKLIKTAEKCIGCGTCAASCPNAALDVSGKQYTPDEVFAIVNQDKLFYKNSGGGVTFSGGEPLLFSDYILPVAQKCRREGYNTAVETCGYFDMERAEKLLPFIDIFLFDIKLIDDKRHKKECCKSNHIIHENFNTLVSEGKKLIPRIPIIPTINDMQEDLKAFTEFLSPYGDKLTEVHILPYHNLGCAKYDQLGLTYTLPHLKSPDMLRMEFIQTELSKSGLPVIIGG